MRAYYFGNMYLSSIQQGIQAAHATAEMFVKYGRDTAVGFDERYSIALNDWAKNHKVMILLNAGYGETIHELVKLFGDKKNPYPWAPFYEEQAALDGAITTVGIILPEKIYQTAALARVNKNAYRQECVDWYEKPIMDRIYEDGTLAVGPDYNSSGETVVWEYNSFEAKLIEQLNGFGLAR